jgi:transposase InsO family protein
LTIVASMERGRRYKTLEKTSKIEIVGQDNPTFTNELRGEISETNRSVASPGDGGADSTMTKYTLMTLVEARPNARWSLDFVHDQFACGRPLRILNIVDDVTRECLAAIPDTSISRRRVARELTTLIEQRGKPGMIVSDNHRVHVKRHAGQGRRT